MTHARRPHPQDQIEAWRQAGTICRVCGGTGYAKRTMRFWFHRAWRPQVDESCWYCDGAGRLDPAEE